jgi:hypothetical protein
MPWRKAKERFEKYPLHKQEEGTGMTFLNMIL